MSSLACTKKVGFPQLLMKYDHFYPVQCCLVNCIASLDQRPCKFVHNSLSWLSHPFNQSKVQSFAEN